MSYYYFFHLHDLKPMIYSPEIVYIPAVRGNVNLIGFWGNWKRDGTDGNSDSRAHSLPQFTVINQEAFRNAT